MCVCGCVCTLSVWVSSLLSRYFTSVILYSYRLHMCSFVSGPSLSVFWLAELIYLLLLQIGCDCLYSTLFLFFRIDVTFKGVVFLLVIKCGNLCDSLFFSVVFFKCAFRQILFYFPFKYFFLFSLQRSFWCRKCARSRFEITAFAYFTIVWERLPAQVCESVCVNGFSLRTHFCFICVDIFCFSFCIYTYIFPLFFRYSTVPLLCSCSSYPHLVWMPFSSILIKE